MNHHAHRLLGSVLALGRHDRPGCVRSRDSGRAPARDRPQHGVARSPHGRSHLDRVVLRERLHGSVRCVGAVGLVRGAGRRERRAGRAPRDRGVLRHRGRRVLSVPARCLLAAVPRTRRVVAGRDARAAGRRDRGHDCVAARRPASWTCRGTGGWGWWHGRSATPGSGGCYPPAARATSVASASAAWSSRSEEHTSELQSQFHLVCRLLLEKKNKTECLIPFQTLASLSPFYMSFSNYSDNAGDACSTVRILSATINQAIFRLNLIDIDNTYP